MERNSSRTKKLSKEGRAIQKAAARRRATESRIKEAEEMTGLLQAAMRGEYPMPVNAHKISDPLDAEATRALRAGIYVRCSCGWLSKPFRTVEDAEQAGSRHRADEGA